MCSKTEATRLFTTVWYMNIPSIWTPNDIVKRHAPERKKKTLRLPTPWADPLPGGRVRFNALLGEPAPPLWSLNQNGLLLCWG